LVSGPINAKPTYLPAARPINPTSFLAHYLPTNIAVKIPAVLPRGFSNVWIVLKHIQWN